MKPSFIHVAAMACLLSVITTIGIHSLFKYNAATFEQQVILHQNSTYLLNRWWVIIHCLLVIVAMWGFFLARPKDTTPLTGLGFVFFVVFGITETFRQLLILFYLNNLRAQYFVAADHATKLFYEKSITSFSMFGNSLFGLFILTFALGNLFYGLSLLKTTGYSKALGILMIVWSAGSFTALGNEFWKLPHVDGFISKFNLWYQPLMRLLISIWLWKRAAP